MAALLGSRFSSLAALCFATLLLSCEDNQDNDKVLDAVVFATDDLIDVIEAEGSTWIVAVEPPAPGFEINGSLTNEAGGTMTAFGWRNTAQRDNGSGTYLGFTEKLFVDLNQWNSNGMLLTGKLVVSRHYMDFGPPGGALDDVSRTTRYLATITAEGDVKGNFEVDVHAQAGGTTLWTCGVVNGAGVEHGPCYEGQEQ